ncbi:hypothetical protein IB237_23710 [Agrobacterium sp. AGB01]|uniref:hypothetical protein n=1 Tax=Agrobacterium sp. AGB01 TaxID=2769302 RepID=UPI00177C1632|nr:hypothetical protein [Agrobacterium sp. AGB01]MBD9390213.1 hypothetical protein [Agrobacterium sp. AGB01]
MIIAKVGGSECWHSPRAILIPVLVTGIQASPSLWAEKSSFRRADARRLDACDKHKA